MNDETQTPPPASNEQPVTADGAALGDTVPTTQTQGVYAAVTAGPLPPHTAAAATGALSRLESDFEKELAKGHTAFTNWFKSAVAELKLHLKV